MPAYPETNTLETFRSDLANGVIKHSTSLPPSSQFMTVATTYTPSVAYTNSSNLYTVFANTMNRTVQPSGTVDYSFKGKIDYNQTIAQYLAAAAGSGTPAPAPAPVVHSNTVYLGDYVNINSQTNTVNLGAAKLQSVADAVNAQDVPSYKQLQAVQTSLNSSLSTTNANVTSVQSQITQITAGAQITNFQSLLDLVNNLNTTEESHLSSAITTLTNSIDAEKTRALAAESTLNDSLVAEVSRAGAAESAISASVTAENSRATSAESTISSSVTSEVSRAKAAESILSSKDITTINVQSSPVFYADGDQPMAIPSNVFAPFDGFYYTNQAGKKANWYMPTPSLKFSDVQYLSFNACVLSNLQLPYIAVYSKPKGDGSDKASWYNAKYVYEIFTPSTIAVNSTSNPTPYHFYCALSGTDISNMPDFGLQKKLLSLESSPFSIGTIAPSDQILFITLQTNSAAAAGDEKFIVQNFCVCASKTYEYKFSSASLTSAGIASSLSSEASRAIAAEAALTSSLNAQISKEAADIATLNGSISTLSTNLNTSIGAEVTRAGLAETGLQGQITSLTATVNTAVSNAGSNITTVQTNLTSEVNRAQAAEAALTTRCSNLETTINNLNTWLFSAGVVSTTHPVTYPFSRS